MLKAILYLAAESNAEKKKKKNKYIVNEERP